MKRVASGEFNPQRERCLELAANPAAKVKAVRTQQLEELKSENAALLERLAGAGEAVPLQTYERLVKEKSELEAAHAKRLMRLKEVSRTVPFPTPLLSSCCVADPRSSASSLVRFWRRSTRSSDGASSSTRTGRTSDSLPCTRRRGGWDLRSSSRRRRATSVPCR